MQLHPTRATFQVALAGTAMIAVGVAARAVAAVAFGGAMLLTVALGRALALATVTRLRSAGFEMVWTVARRVTRLPRGEELVLEAELRNRGVDDARGIHLRPIASSMLSASVEPTVLELPAASKVRFNVRIRPKRVGRWGLHGLALEVRGMPLGGDGLFEVPLLFANPHGIEVIPRPLWAALSSPRGGRARMSAAVGRPGPVTGDGETLKELREHVPGDPFKRIAWKASARRGQLLVREMERDERDVVWLILDASVELWAGEPGCAPLDIATEEVGSVAARHLTRGDRVGLVVFASRLRTWLTPDSGPRRAAEIAAALASTASTVDSNRCQLTEQELASRVAEHLRPLDTLASPHFHRMDLDALAARADALRARAPFAPRLPLASSPREQRFRHYLAAFGIEVPPRIDGERERAAALVAELLERVAHEKRPRASIVHVWAPAPKQDDAHLERAIRKLRAARAEVRWTMPNFDPSLASDEVALDSVAGAVRDALRLRVAAAQRRAERTLRAMGVRAVVVSTRRTTHGASTQGTAEPERAQPARAAAAGIMAEEA